MAFDSSILTKHSLRRNISWSFSVQRDAKGCLSAIVATGVDVTDKCAAEALLAEARDAATHAQQQTEELSSQLEEVRTQLSTAGDEARGGLRPFQQLGQTPGSDRRQKPRRAYPYIQLIAPMKDDRLPVRSAFSEVLCHDISASGFSFFAPQPPPTDCAGRGLWHPQHVHLSQAHVVHCRRTEDGGKFLIGCQYTGRVQV